MKKIGKVAVLLAIVLAIVLSITTKPVYAHEIKDGGVAGSSASSTSGSQGGLPNINAYTPTNEEMPQNVTDVISLITTVFQVIGIAIAVIMIIVIGIKYMVGSVEQKANYKKSMVPYIVGAVLVFSTATIVKLVASLTSSALYFAT